MSAAAGTRTAQRGDGCESLAARADRARPAPVRRALGGTASPARRSSSTRSTCSRGWRAAPPPRSRTRWTSSASGAIARALTRGFVPDSLPELDGYEMGLRVRAGRAPARRRRPVRRVGAAPRRPGAAGRRRGRQGGRDRGAERHDALLHRGPQLGQREPRRGAAPGQRDAAQPAAERHLRDRLPRLARRRRAALRQRRPPAPRCCCAPVARPASRRPRPAAGDRATGRYEDTR